MWKHIAFNHIYWKSRNKYYCFIVIIYYTFINCILITVCETHVVYVSDMNTVI